MATHDVQNQRIANEGSAPAETAASEMSSGWFVEFSDALLALSLTLKRAFIIISAIGLGAIATAYLSANTGYYQITAGALAVFGLTILAWVVAAGYLLWRIGSGVVRWWANRVPNPRKLTDGETG